MKTYLKDKDLMFSLVHECWNNARACEAMELGAMQFSKAGTWKELTATLEARLRDWLSQKQQSSGQKRARSTAAAENEDLADEVVHERTTLLLRLELAEGRRMSTVKPMPQNNPLPRSLPLRKGNSPLGRRRNASGRKKWAR